MNEFENLNAGSWNSEDCDDDFPLSDEVKQDLQDIIDGKDLIGAFHNLDDLFKSLGI